MADQIYKVRDPTGAIREIKGPEGATDEQVIEQAQKLFADPTAPSAVGVTPSEALRTGASLLTSGRIPLSERARFPDIPDLVNKAAYGVGGAVTDVAAKVLPPEVAAAAGAITNAGLQAIPISTGAKLGAEVGAPAMRWAAENRMTSALKPGVESLKGGSGVRAVNTMLDEGINVTKGGIDKMKGIIADLNSQVSAKIATAPPGAIDKATVAGELRYVLDRFKSSLDAKKDMPSIMQSWDDLLNHPIFRGRYLTIQDAQKMKQGIQMKLADSFGELSTAAREGQKAVSSGLRKAISTLEPSVAPLNARESAMLNALEYAEKRVLSEGNKNVGGLAFLANNTAAATAFMADKSSAFNSILARMLNAHKRTIPATAAGSGIYNAMNETTE